MPKTLLRTYRMLLACAAILEAQTGGKRVVSVPAADLAAFEKSRKIAILAGVGDYPKYSGIGKLQYPSSDVDLMAGRLRAHGYTVIALKDGEATRGAVRSVLGNVKEVLDQWDGTLVFFFSGHGWATDGHNMLATYDAEGGNLSGSGLAMEEVVRLMAATGARRRVAWIDACRNEPGKATGVSRTFAAWNRSEGTRVLFSTRSGRMSFESRELKQGVFTHFLARALNGEAAGADGLLTFRDVADFVTGKVQEWGLQHGDLQIPYEGVGAEASGDFLLGKVAAPTKPEAGDIWVNPKNGLRYSYIPAGKFRMGCPLEDRSCYSNELPARDVTLTKGYWLGQVEVTVEAYKRYMIAVGGKMPGEPEFCGRKLNDGWQNGMAPMVNVSWPEAKGYCEWSGGRLPTEAEWERAARGGTTGARFGALEEIAWFGDNAGEKRLDAEKLWTETGKDYVAKLAANGNAFHEVGLRRPNGYRLYDMLGNVWEWTHDWYGEKFYEAGEGKNPAGPPNGANRVVRGGSWYDTARILRATVRFWDKPEFRSFNVGFRCVQEE